VQCPLALKLEETPLKLFFLLNLAPLQSDYMTREKVGQKGVDAVFEANTCFQSSNGACMQMLESTYIPNYIRPVAVGVANFLPCVVNYHMYVCMYVCVYV
jgi:hypothetical protein